MLEQERLQAVLDPLPTRMLTQPKQAQGEPSSESQSDVQSACLWRGGLAHKRKVVELHCGQLMPAFYQAQPALTACLKNTIAKNAQNL